MPKIIHAGQVEVDTSLPYTDEEMREAYDNFVSESKNTGEFDSCEEKLSQTKKVFSFPIHSLYVLELFNMWVRKLVNLIDSPGQIREKYSSLAEYRC